MTSTSEAMSARKNIAAAVRQSSLSRSSRMGELLDRFENGMACGTPDDIDFLIDEIVQRIEERLLRRIAQLPDIATSTSKDKQNGGTQTNQSRELERPRRVAGEDTLRHEARLIVAQIINIVQRRLEKKIATSRDKNQYRNVSSKTDKEYKCGRPQVINKYNDNRNRGTLKRDQVTEMEPRRLVYQDGDTFNAATTYSLRREAKSSLRRYSVTGNVKALMCACEWAKNDDVRVLSVPTKVTTPLYDNIEMLLEPRAAPIEDHRFCEEAPCRKLDTVPMVFDDKPKKEWMKSERPTNYLNSSYTYARRAEIKKALPKFLTARCCDAMMTMFNAIRVAMAEQEVESLDYVDLLAGLINTSKEINTKTTKSAKTPTQKRYYPSVNATREQVPQSRQKEVHDTADSSKTDHKLPRKSRDRLATRQNNFGTLGTYTLRKATRSCLGHMLHRGSSYNALLMMTRNIRVGQTEEEFWEQTLDLDLDEATRKEVISDLVEFAKHARADKANYADFPAHSSREITSNVNRTDFTEEDDITTSQSGTVDAQSTRHIRDEQTDMRSDPGGVMVPTSHTNYRYGMHRSLRRILPKFTGRRPYSALMHYVNNMITDAQQDLPSCDQFVPTINNPVSRDEPRQQTQRKNIEEERQTKPHTKFALDRNMISSQIKEETEAKDEGDSFYDAYSWVAQPLSDNNYQTSSEIKQQRPKHDQDQDDDRWLGGYEDGMDDDDDFFPADHIDDDMVTTGSSPAYRDDSDTEVSQKRSVRFADGINPGDSDENGADVSQFFQKLGYYERVGSGELLHKKSQKKVQRTEDTTATSQTQSQTESKPKEEPPAERPPSDMESQDTPQVIEKPATLCNCL